MKSKTDLFLEKQLLISDEELYELVCEELIKLCKTGGRSMTMCIPPNVTDTDMLIYDLLRRFRQYVLMASSNSDLVKDVRLLSNIIGLSLGEASDSIIKIAYGITHLDEQKMPNDVEDMQHCEVAWFMLPDHRKNEYAAKAIAHARKHFKSNNP